MVKHPEHNKHDELISLVNYIVQTNEFELSLIW